MVQMIPNRAKRHYRLKQLCNSVTKRLQFLHGLLEEKFYNYSYSGVLKANYSSSGVLKAKLQRVAISC